MVVTSALRRSFGSGEMLTRVLPDTGLVITDKSLILLAIFKYFTRLEQKTLFD